MLLLSDDDLVDFLEAPLGFELPAAVTPAVSSSGVVLPNLVPDSSGLNHHVANIAPQEPSMVSSKQRPISDSGCSTRVPTPVRPSELGRTTPSTLCESGSGLCRLALLSRAATPDVTLAHARELNEIASQARPAAERVRPRSGIRSGLRTVGAWTEEIEQRSAAGWELSTPPSPDQLAALTALASSRPTSASLGANAHPIASQSCTPSRPPTADNKSRRRFRAVT